MIYDSIDRIERYAAIHSRMQAAIELLKNLLESDPQPGRYYPGGRETDEVFANVSEVESKPGDGRTMEFHRRYADLQAPVSGRERFGFAPATAAGEIEEPYREEKDFGTFRLNAGEDPTFVHLTRGRFVIVLPTEPHAPCVAEGDQPEPLKKIVVKIRMD